MESCLLYGGGCYAVGSHLDVDCMPIDTKATNHELKLKGGRQTEAKTYHPK